MSIKIDVEANSVRFRSGLEKMKAEARSTFTGMGDTFKQMGSWLAGALTVGSVKALIDEFSELVDTADRLHDSVEVVQRVGLVAQTSATSLDKITSSMEKLDRKVAENLVGLTNNAKAFKAMGIEAEKFLGLGLEEKILLLAQGYDEANKKGLAGVAMQDLFGKSAGELVPLLMQGKEALKQQFDGSSALSDEGARALEALGDQWDIIWQKTKVYAATGLGTVIMGLKLVEMAGYGIGYGFVKMFNLVTGKGGESLDWLDKRVRESVDEFMKLGDSFIGTDLSKSNAKNALTERLKKEREEQKQALIDQAKDEAAAAHQKEVEEYKQQAEKEQRDKDAAKKEEDARNAKAYKDYEDGERLKVDREIAQTDDPQKKRELEKTYLMKKALTEVNELEYQRLRLAIDRISAEERADQKREQREKAKLAADMAKATLEDLEEKKQNKLDNELNFTVDDFRARGGGGRVGTGGGQSAEIQKLSEQIDIAKQTYETLQKIYDKMGEGGSFK